MGTILATTILSDSTSVLGGALAFAVLFGLQLLVSKLRMQSDRMERLLESSPRLLVANGWVLHDHLKAVRMTEHDLQAMLRAGGIVQLSGVFAAVLETSGDVSVVQSGSLVDAWLFANVRGAELLEFDE